MSRYHILLIGIDSYAIKPLHGCVNDVDAVQRLLLSPRMGIPRESIKCPSRLITTQNTRPPLMLSLRRLQIFARRSPNFSLKTSSRVIASSSTTRVTEHVYRSALPMGRYFTAKRSYPSTSISNQTGGSSCLTLSSISCLRRSLRALQL